MRLLIGEDFSPWTEKACWALDHHGIGYTFRQFLPLVGEPWLRVKIRKFSKRVTVPALVEGREVFDDSYAIARRAEGLGGGPALWPAGRAAEVEAWNDASERALRAGRALFFGRLLGDDAALLDQVPPLVPGPLRRPFLPAVRATVRYLRAKHGADETFTAGAYRALDEALAGLREALGKGDYLLGDFSYADVAMAVVCQFVCPVDDRYIKLAPATRACWAEPGLAERHRDVIAWRDRLYARHRRPARG
jgi:glutathione S-transferase